MLKLENVSKFYYQNNMITTGFAKVNLQLNNNEFVTIVGESGSGKSTLLNVLSGLDTYEEGELYINGQPTSHYEENEFEEYRKKYVANIFQNFNLINSYTVYQNVELVMLLNGYKRKEIKNKVNQILVDVGLEKFKRQKVSKLSGGQKQRVAIARALAKETPIIIADEPTGNIDVKAADEIIALLAQIAKNKLVIVVTHNYEQFEQYTTRKIKMSDGHIIEDEVIRNVDSSEVAVYREFKQLSIFNTIRISMRNTFNIWMKFVLLLIVYCFLSGSVLFGYSSINDNDKQVLNMGYNNYFKSYDGLRIIVKQKNSLSFNEEQLTKMEQIKGVNYINKNDLLLDSNITISLDYLFISGSPLAIEDIKGKQLMAGNMPTNDNEIVVGYQNEFDINENTKKMIGQEVSLTDEYNNKIGTCVVSGLYYDKNMPTYSALYLSKAKTDQIYHGVIRKVTKLKSLFASHYYVGENGMSQNNVMPSPNVAPGEVLISEDLAYNCKNFKCKGYGFKVESSNIYSNGELNLTVSNQYSKKTFTKLTGYGDYDMNQGAFFISSADFDSLFNTSPFQISVFVESKEDAHSVLKELNDLGYDAFYVEDHNINPFQDLQKLSNLFQYFVYGLIGLGIFFISYFIIQLIMKSRNVYYSTLRILGTNKKVINRLLAIELMVIKNIGFVLMAGLFILCRYEYLSIEKIYQLSLLLKPIDYVILWVVISIISYLITKKYSKKLFKESAMKTYRNKE
ncbi:MAG: ABC transporter ATP-binding protein [Erysipelotrichaceae bacterium]